MPFTDMLKPITDRLNRAEEVIEIMLNTFQSTASLEQLKEVIKLQRTINIVLFFWPVLLTILLYVIL